MEWYIMETLVKEQRLNRQPNGQVRLYGKQVAPK
jgi:hypothetical protein